MDGHNKNEVDKVIQTDRDKNRHKRKQNKRQFERGREETDGQTK